MILWSDRLRQSTPLRLTFILMAVFLVSILLSFAVAFVVLRNSVDESLRNQLAQQFASLLLIDDQTDLTERITQQAATADPVMQIVRYVPDAGPDITNLPGFVVAPDFGIIDGTSINAPDAATSYLATTTRVGAGRLTLAFARDQISELREVFWTVFILSPLITLISAGGIGLWIARTARDRVEAIRTTLNTLTEGDLSARVPASDHRPDDLTQIGLAVNRMAASQEATLASLQQVSADIAHDLKTPIQRVSVLLERLDNQGPLLDTQRDTVAAARMETEQIVRTFHSLLQIAQIEGGAAHDMFSPVDLAAIAATLTEVYEATAEDTGHVLTFSSSGPAIIPGEKNLLGQVVANLIENSLRHSARGSRIGVEVLGTPGSATLIVRDTGPGIPEAERGNVLRRLYRLERSRTTEGNGLGLSLVAAIVDLHGATLTLGDNNPGLLVEVTFPRADQPDK